MMVSMDQRPLRPKLLELLLFIDRYIEENGFAPSYDEMVDATVARSKSVVAHYLKDLERRGWIGRTPNVSRSIQILRPVPGRGNSADGKHRKVPFWGRISAGTPISIPENGERDPEEDIDVDTSLLPRKYAGRDLFALKVQGNSMIDAGVLSGDIIIVEPVPQVDNGDMAVVWFPDESETTLKYFYRKGDRIRLKPANSSFPEMEYDARTVEVKGRLVMTMRVY